MEINALRDKALQAIDTTRFVPPAGRNRLRSMIEQRPDWCISRQRLWGVPLPIFVDKKTGEPLRDARVLERVAAAFEAEGGDAWFASDPQRFLGDRSEEHTSELQSLMRISYAVFCLKKKTKTTLKTTTAKTHTTTHVTKPVQIK